MFDFVRFLREVTQDGSWQELNGRLLNSKQNEAHFAIDAGQTTFFLNGKAIYIGPIETDYPAYA